MVDQFIASAGAYIHTNPWLAIVAVFLGGAITASSPCVLAMIPLTMAFVAGRDQEHSGAWRSLGYALIFVVGLSITFTVLGMTAALAGQLYGDVSGVWTWIVVVVCLIMGLHLMGALDFTIPMPFEVKPRIRGAAGALILGLLFGVVSAPCAAPILVVLLTYLAGGDASVTYGGFLLFVYALGHSVLIIVAGVSMGAARTLIESKRGAQASALLRKGAGAVIVLVGAFFAYEGLS